MDVTILRDSTHIYTGHEESNVFSETLTKNLNSIKHGDKILFYNIRYRTRASGPAIAHPFEITVN